ncbi:MAG: glycine/sarcosine/betaine reductase selenoprotein B family protein [Hyphomicrobiaceae bacterium]
MVVRYIDSITKRYERLGFAPYRWFHADDQPPWTPLPKSLSGLRLGMLSTSGAYVAGQLAYHYKDDTTIREISTDTPIEQIRFSHITENYLVNARQDPDCILPLTALRRLAHEGVIGQLAKSVLTCMGGIYSQRRVMQELIPAVTTSFAAQEVDAVLLVPM